MKRSLFITLALGLGFTLALLGWLTGQAYVVRAHPGIRYVAPDGDDGRLCNSITNRCRRVQRAIDVAEPFDEIRVTEGIYTDAGGGTIISWRGHPPLTQAIRRGYRLPQPLT